jgi:hypothetical protein
LSIAQEEHASALDLDAEAMVRDKMLLDMCAMGSFKPAVALHVHV